MTSASPGTKPTAGTSPSWCYQELAAGRHEGFCAISLPTRTHNQRVMAPLTMSSMGLSSPSSQTPLLVVGQAVVLGRDLPPQMLSSELFLLDSCF